MAQEDRSQIVRSNERIKFIADVLKSWGNGLLIAALGTWAIKGFGQGLDALVFLYLVSSGLCLAVAYHILGLLEADDQHE